MALIAVFSTACGGGTSNVQPPPGNTTTSLSGQLQQDASAKVSSAASASLSGATVSAISTSSGSVQATQTVDANGNFDFTSLPAGDYMLRVQFNGNADFNGDGSLDKVDVLLPVTLNQGANANVDVTFTAENSQGSGQPDSIQVKCDVSGSLTATVHRLEMLNFRSGELTLDANGNASLSDDTPAVDADGDGIPDFVTGSLNALHGGVLHGQISAIGGGSLTVDGVTFNITSATQFKAQGDASADQAQFTVGSEVLVSGLWNGTEWIALDVKLAGQGSGNGGGGGGLPAVQATFGGEITAVSDNSLSVGGNQLSLDASTEWKGRGGALDAGQFNVGDIVLVRATFDGSNWDAKLVFMLVDANTGGGGNGGGGGGVPVTATFNGSIEAMAGGSLTVHDTTIDLDSSTQWMANGSLTSDLSLFDVGDEVLVTATFDGMTWTATQVKLTVNHVPDNGGGGGGTGPITATFTGDIEAQTDGSLTLHDQSIALNAGTQWMADGSLTTDLSLFDIGDEVQVLATSADGGATWTATLVTLTVNNVPDDTAPGSPKMASFDGNLTALSATALTVDGQEIQLNTDTQWMADGTLTGDMSLFGVGDEVKVLAEQDGDAWVALKVTLEHKHLL
jgi:hypothetical protein